MDEDKTTFQNELLKVLVFCELEEKYESTEERAKCLSNFDFTHAEIGEILSKDRTTISKAL